MHYSTDQHSERTPSESGTAGSSVAGRRIARYEVREAIGAGGMGVVMSAYDPELCRMVALKLLKPQECSERGRRMGARLLREAQAMARLSHPNVVRVYDAGVWHEQVFVAMELVHGRTLTKWLAESARSWRAVLKVFVAAGRGLAAAHGAGLVHRDFKPDNVLIDHDGAVRVMDFGLATAMARSEASLRAGAGMDDSMLDVCLTLPRKVVGTPAYMAPEQHLGRPATETSDQYSFCIALYQALFGSRPFAGASMKQLGWNKLRGQFTAPRGRGVPAWLRRVLQRGLARRAEDRFPSMEALLSRLDSQRGPSRGAWLRAVGFATAAVVGMTGFSGFDTVETDRTESLADDIRIGSASHAEMRDQLAQAETLENTGDLRAGLHLAQAALHTATALDDANFVAPARYRVGRVLDKLGQYDRAAENLSEAFYAAVSVRQDRLAASAAAELVHILGDRLANTDQATAWARHADVVVRRIGSDSAEQDELRYSLGLVARVEHDREVAPALLERAVARR